MSGALDLLVKAKDYLQSTVPFTIHINNQTTHALSLKSIEINDKTGINVPPPLHIASRSHGDAVLDASKIFAAKVVIAYSISIDQQQFLIRSDYIWTKEHQGSVAVALAGYNNDLFEMKEIKHCEVGSVSLPGVNFRVKCISNGNFVEILVIEK